MDDVIKTRKWPGNEKLVHSIVPVKFVKVIVMLVIT